MNKLEELIDEVISYAKDTYANDKLAAAKQALLDAFPHWIRVNARLPRDQEKVLLIIYGDAQTGRHNSQLLQWETESGTYSYGLSYKDVTHWMPLPLHIPPELETVLSADEWRRRNEKTAESNILAVVR